MIRKLTKKDKEALREKRKKEEEAKKRAQAELSSSAAQAGYREARDAGTLSRWQESRANLFYQDRLEQLLKEVPDVPWPQGVPRFSLGESAVISNQGEPYPANPSAAQQAGEELAIVRDEGQNKRSRDGDGNEAAEEVAEMPPRKRIA